jgi:hypothetical protein
MAGVRLTPVHYRGGAPALTDVIGGHTQVLFISVTLMNQPWKAGQLKALGVGGGKRSAAVSRTADHRGKWLTGLSGGVLVRAICARGNTCEHRAQYERRRAAHLLRSDFPEIHTRTFFEPIVGSADAFVSYGRTEQLR